MWACKIVANFKASKMKSQVGDHILIKNTVPVTSITSLAEGYLINCRCEAKSEATINNYQDRLQRFAWFCQVNDYPDEPQKISANHIRQFLWYLASEPNRWGGDHPSSRKPASQSTVNNYYRVLNTFFGWLEKEELIADNPVAHLKTPRFDHKVVQALSPNEIKRLLDTCSGKSMLEVRNKAILSILLDTGLRVSEFASLRLEDVDVNTGAILVRRGKGGKQRVVRIGLKAQKALWRYVTIYSRGGWR